MIYIWRVLIPDPVFLLRITVTPHAATSFDLTGKAFNICFNSNFLSSSFSWWFEQMGFSLTDTGKRMVQEWDEVLAPKRRYHLVQRLCRVIGNPHDEKASFKIIMRNHTAALYGTWLGTTYWTSDNRPHNGSVANFRPYYWNEALFSLYRPSVTLLKTL